MFRKVKISLLILILIACFIEINADAQQANTDITLVINELMASNSTCICDEQDQYDDWIEIYNYSSSQIDLGGMYLTDDLSTPAMWQIPDGTTISGRGYILIWLDNDDDQEGLHANFRLDTGGEEIGLFDSDGVTLIDSVTYPEQTTDISYGRYPDGGDNWYFSDLPTPSERNNRGYLGVVSDTTFSHDRGFYDDPFHVEITTQTDGATIRYTTDGSTPTETYGRIYSGPVTISTTTCLRAIASKADFKSTNVDTQTYIFLDDVIEQTGRGLPNTWGHAGADYEMDPDVVDDYRDTIIEDLKSIPTMSLVMNINDWFNGSSSPSTGGIYAHPDWEDQYAEQAERTVSVEFFDPATSDQFQLNAGVRLAGGSSTSPWKMDKLSMRLKFTNLYGPTKLRFPLFGDDAADEFDTLVLDARMNNSWAYGGGVMLPNSSRPWIQGRPTQRDVAQYTRDQFVCDIQNAAGGYGPHGRHVHLYLNGIYWGLYNVHERPDENFASAYLGGRDEDYDAIKHNAGNVINGSGSNYSQMFSLANGGLSSNSQYQQIRQYLDVTDLINYMITNFYVGNTDWAHQNWYATFNRVDPEGRWRFHSWDAEHVMEALNANVTGRDDNGGPTRLHRRLRGNAEYRLLFADYVHRHFFNDGILTPEGAAYLYQIRLDEVDRAVVGESARWGDNHESTSRTRDIDWVRERDWLLSEYFPNRSAIVLQQLRNDGLYPNVDAPVFYINGSYQHGGHVNSGDHLSMDYSGGSVWYTLDGTDPRSSQISQQNDNTTILVPADYDKRVLVPSEPIRSSWNSSYVFNDLSWLRCTGRPGGIGYEVNSGYENFISLDVVEQMYGLRTTCYIRIPFTFDGDPGDFDLLTLNISYDDGFIAYLNGAEIARVNFSGTPQWNSQAGAGHEASASLDPFDVSEYIGDLKQGENILAIQGLNQSITSSDFLIWAELVAQKTSSEDISSTAVRYNRATTLTESVHVKARLKSGNTWSALNEAVFAVGPVAENLRITEIMYHPQGMKDPNEEFVELKNIGTETINLNMVSFTNGIDFTFPSTELQPDEYVLVVKDISAFTDKYGTDLNIAGQYSGQLNNGGERIELNDAYGRTILDFSYKDNWYDTTDGDGFSLTVVNPAGTDATQWGEKNTWRASTDIDGSPGRDD